ncbi:MAG: hypothetical protein WCI90_02300 [Chlorobium sp.]|nr:MAG: hypothetical protein FDX17_09250 [Chlorobium sp.]
MQTIETTPQPTAQAIQRPRQRFLSTEQALQYIKDVYGVKVARATLYKKRSIEKGAFIGQRSPFGKLVFDPAEIDRYMMAGQPAAAVQTEGGQA